MQLPFIVIHIYSNLYILRAHFSTIYRRSDLSSVSKIPANTIYGSENKHSNNASCTLEKQITAYQELVDCSLPFLFQRYLIWKKIKLITFMVYFIRKIKEQGNENKQNQTKQTKTPLPHIWPCEVEFRNSTQQISYHS